MAVGQAGSDVIQQRNATAQNKAGLQSSYTQQANSNYQQYMDTFNRLEQEEYDRQQAIIDQYLGVQRDNAQMLYDREQDAYLKSRDVKTDATEYIQQLLASLTEDGTFDEADRTTAQNWLDTQKGYTDDVKTKQDLQDIWDMYVRATEQDVEKTAIEKEGATVTNSKTTEQVNAKDLDSVLASINNSAWSQSGWNKFWNDNPEFTYGGLTYRVETTTNYAGKNSEAVKAIKGMTSNGKTVVVTYKGKDYITDGETIYQVNTDLHLNRL